MRQFLLLWFLASLVPADKDKSVAPPPAHAVPTLRCYLTETTPTIDGKLGEACWTHGEVATYFQQLHLRGTAGEQTKAMVTYDAGNLYIGSSVSNPT